MVEKIRNNRITMLLLLTGAVYFFLKVIVPVTAPILLAMLFVTIFGPLLQRMQKRLRLHRQAGAVLLLLIACVFLGALVWVLFSWIVGSLPDWVDGLETLEKNMGVIVHRICETVGRTIRIDSEYLENTIFSGIQQGIDYFQLQFLPGMFSQSLE